MERMKSEIVNRRSAALRYDQTLHTKSGKMAVEKSAEKRLEVEFLRIVERHSHTHVV